VDKDLAGVGEVTLLIAVALVTLLPEEVGMKLDRKDIMVKVDIVVSVFAVVHLLAAENEFYDDVFHYEIARKS